MSDPARARPPVLFRRDQIRLWTVDPMLIIHASSCSRIHAYPICSYMFAYVYMWLHMFLHVYIVEIHRGKPSTGLHLWLELGRCLGGLPETSAGGAVEFLDGSWAEGWSETRVDHISKAFCSGSMGFNGMLMILMGYWSSLRCHPTWLAGKSPLHQNWTCRPGMFYCHLWFAEVILFCADRV